MKKIVHLIPDEKFTDFVIESFSRESSVENFFICFSDDSQVIHTRSKALKKMNISKFASSPEILMVFENANIIMSHSLNETFSKVLLKYLNKKIVWFCWGGEIYNYHPTLVENNFEKITRQFFAKRFKGFFLKLWSKYYLTEIGLYRGLLYYQKKVIKHIDVICPVINEDFNIIKKLYSVKSTVLNYEFIYGNKYTLLTNDVVPIVEKGNVLIGNSSTYTNNHLDIFEGLSYFSAQALPKKFFVPLNYGDEKYREIVKKCGYDKLDSLFFPLDSFIEKDEYLKLIASCSYFILPVRRQQGIGNLYAMVNNGANVYVYKGTPIYLFMKRKGFYFSTIEDLFFEKRFKKLSELEISHNKFIIEEMLSVEKTQKDIKKLIDV